MACLALALSGCVIEADYTGTHFRCDDGKTCPDGFQCIAGFCESNPDLAVSVDGGTDLTLVLPPACGKTEDFIDNFDNGQPAAFWTVSGATQGGQLTVSLPNGPSSGLYTSKSRTDLTGSRLYIDVISATNTSGNAEAFLRLRFDSDNWIQIVQRHGSLFLEQNLGGAVTDPKMLTYDNVAHRWWRLRETGGTVFFDTSLDGSASTWTQQGSTPTPAFAASVFIEIGADAPANELSPGNAQFDNLNGGGPPLAPACDM
jgi:hypothetical protein